MHLHVDPHGVVPPSQQLVAGVLDAIARGDLRPGDRLPAVRVVATQAMVNPNTVSKAWRELEHLGVTEGRNGTGVFVTAAGPRVARSVRLAATLADLRAAVRAAISAGQDEENVRAAVDAELRGAPVGGTT